MSTTKLGRILKVFIQELPKSNQSRLLKQYQDFGARYSSPPPSVLSSKKSAKKKTGQVFPSSSEMRILKILLRNPLNMELDYTTINFHLLTFTYQLSSKKSAKNRSSIPLFLREFQKSCSEILQTWSLITPRLFHLLTFTY